jgi:dUTP pyrophosphatase
MSVLPANDIKRLIGRQPPLLEGYSDIKEQLQPNGFDITLKEIGMLQTSGRIETDNSRRVISGLETVEFDQSGYVDLLSGCYIVTFNEIVHLPNNIMALGKPRSSLLRCGVAIHNAVWDAGYSGRSQALLVVYNTSGFTIQKNSRVLQLVFMTLSSETEGYKGIYQGENI